MNPWNLKGCYGIQIRFIKENVNKEDINWLECEDNFLHYHTVTCPLSSYPFSTHIESNKWVKTNV